MKSKKVQPRLLTHNGTLLVIFCLVLLFICSSLYGYHIQTLYISQIHKLNEENERLSSKNTNVHPRINGTQLENNDQNVKIPKWNDEEYLLGYSHWIKGIGNKHLSNENMTNCHFPVVPYRLSKSQGLNNDPFYKEMHECYSWKFSQMYHRIITITCDKVVHYFQSESLFVADYRMINDSQWIKLQKSETNVYTFTLGNMTQIVWLRCRGRYNFHLSPLALKERDPVLHKKLEQKNEKLYKNATKPPNIVILALDSTSRANFIRACPQSVEYLSKLMTFEASKVSVYQHFRYSTVGWGTSNNLGALFGGKVSGNDHKNDENLIGLAEYFEHFGYYSIGFDEWRQNEHIRATWQQNEWSFALSKNFGNEYCWIKQREDVDLYSEFVLESINNMQKKDDLPYFIALHSIANHAANGAYLFNLDRYIQRLLEYLDFENTILHIVADHGCMIGSSVSTIFGRMEASNPVSILIMPKNKRFEQFDEYLRMNEQRMITHYDIHRFYKSIPLIFVHNDIKNIQNILSNDNLYEFEFEKLNIGKSLPCSKNAQKMAKNILTEFISNNRSCDGIDVGFCVCDTKNVKNINSITQNKLVSFAINAINNLTGNGEWNCIKYDPTDFVIILYLENERRDGLEIVIEERRKNNQNEHEYKIKKEQNLWLTFVIEFELKGRDKQILSIPMIEKSKMKLPAITRVDWFKYEECIITHYDPFSVFPNDKAEIFASNKKRNPLDPLHPIFKDYNLTRQVAIFVIKCQNSSNTAKCCSNIGMLGIHSPCGEFHFSEAKSCFSFLFISP